MATTGTEQIASCPAGTRERQAVLEAAVGWLGTPYHHRAMVKGAGVDCALLLAAVYRGVTGEVQIPQYPPDWHLHRDEEKYLGVLLEHCRPVETPSPADIALFRFGRAYSHGAIVIAWPRLIHSYLGVGVEIVSDATRDGRLMNRPVKFFSPWRAE